MTFLVGCWVGPFDIRVSPEMQKCLVLSHEDRTRKNTYMIYTYEKELRRQGLGEQVVHCTRTSSKGSLLFTAEVTADLCIYPESFLD